MVTDNKSNSDPPNVFSKTNVLPIFPTSCRDHEIFGVFHRRSLHLARHLSGHMVSPLLAKSVYRHACSVNSSFLLPLFIIIVCSLASFHCRHTHIPSPSFLSDALNNARKTPLQAHRHTRTYLCGRTTINYHPLLLTLPRSESQVTSKQKHPFFLLACHTHLIVIHTHTQTLIYMHTYIHTEQTTGRERQARNASSSSTPSEQPPGLGHHCIPPFDYRAQWCFWGAWERREGHPKGPEGQAAAASTRG